ncbi:DsbA family oxidoreductase [Gracilibacillus sp. S3-1-1]|uniref:DsbA family oxidoreductase n=1 Tax=Gracilibacillus pellucidus TaxID=3095368 RepID=A0ACC6M8Y6_9BACI|nr:DsbA family oxidoreductase [Gracilibacillus sp. S3-1-1]MDX8047434.1 DsbA family oxidoreductase [Gracilibacillus sp. S3-1-1]
MKIEIWSDFVCPFCYIGKTRLEQAIERFPEKLDVDIEYKSFELDPNAPKYSGVSINESLAKKYNMSIEQAKAANEQIGEQAKAVGLDFVFDTMKPGNTFDAHRISKYAATVGREAEFVNTMLYNYFTLSKDVSDKDTLLAITNELGFDQEKVQAILNDETIHADLVRQDEAEAQQLGITGVPFFVINKKYAISGAQPIETFMQALEKVAEEENNQLQHLNFEQGSFCDGDNCN